MVSLFPSFSHSIGLAGTFFMFSIVSMLGVAYGLWILPETRGKTLHEINRMFYNENSSKVSNTDGYLSCPQK